MKTLALLVLTAVGAWGSTLTNDFRNSGYGTNSINFSFQPNSTPFVDTNGNLIYSAPVGGRATNGIMSPTYVVAGNYTFTFGPQNDQLIVNVPSDNNTYSVWMLATNLTSVTNFPNISGLFALTNWNTNGSQQGWVAVSSNNVVQWVPFPIGGGGIGTLDPMAFNTNLNALETTTNLDLSFNSYLWPHLDVALDYIGQPGIPTPFLWFGDSTGLYTYPTINTFMANCTSNAFQPGTPFNGGGNFYAQTNTTSYNLVAEPNYYWGGANSFEFASGSNVLWGGPSESLQYAPGNELQIWIEASASNGVANVYTSPDFSVWTLRGNINEAALGGEGIIVVTNYAIPTGSYAVKVVCTSGIFRMLGAGLITTNSYAPTAWQMNAPGQTLQNWTNMGVNVQIILTNIFYNSGAHGGVVFYQQIKNLITFNNYTNFFYQLTNYATNADIRLISAPWGTSVQETTSYPQNSSYQMAVTVRNITITNKSFAGFDDIGSYFSDRIMMTNLGFADVSGPPHLNSLGQNAFGNVWMQRSGFIEQYINNGKFNTGPYVYNNGGVGTNEYFYTSFGVQVPSGYPIRLYSRASQEATITAAQTTNDTDWMLSYYQPTDVLKIKGAGGVYLAVGGNANGIGTNFLAGLPDGSVMMIPVTDALWGGSAGGSGYGLIRGLTIGGPMTNGYAGSASSIEQYGTNTYFGTALTVNPNFSGTSIFGGTIQMAPAGSSGGVNINGTNTEASTVSHTNLWQTAGTLRAVDANQHEFGLASNYYTGTFPAANLTGTLATNNLAASGNGGQGNLLVEGSSTQAVFTNFGMVAGLRYVLTNTGSGVTAVPTYVGYWMELTASNATAQTGGQPNTNWQAAISNTPSGVNIFNAPTLLTGGSGVNGSNITCNIGGSVTVDYQTDQGNAQVSQSFIFCNNVPVFSFGGFGLAGGTGVDRGFMISFSTPVLAGDKIGGGSSLTTRTNGMLRVRYDGP